MKEIQVTQYQCGTCGRIERFSELIAECEAKHVRELAVIKPGNVWIDVGSAILESSGSSWYSMYAKGTVIQRESAGGCIRALVEYKSERHWWTASDLLRIAADAEWAQKRAPDLIRK